MARVFGFPDERSYRRVVEEVRRSRNRSDRGAQRRRQPPVLGGGGTSGQQIIFSPRDVCPGFGFACDCVEAEVITSACGSGPEVGSLVKVFDFNRCFFNMPEQLLFNSRGFATKYKNFGIDTTPGEYEYESDDCIWVVTGMCCVEG